MTFERLTQDEVTHVLSLLPAVVYQQLQRENVVLAGGAIRDTLAGIPVKDIDIFCHSEEQAARLALELAPFARHTTFAYTVPLEGLPVQYVYYKDFTTPEDLVSQFDFRACCHGIYWNGAEFEGVSVLFARLDCVMRELRFLSQLKDAGKLTALRRALDFAPKGWTISDEDLAGILTHFEPSIQPDRARRSFRPCYGRL
jgi:hypothetical protein